MRTTPSIDDDVMERVRAVAAKLRTPFKAVVNEALRAGLDYVEQPAKHRRYKQMVRQSPTWSQTHI